MSRLLAIARFAGFTGFRFPPRRRLFDGGITVEDLALAQDAATISPLLRRLEAAGFITRQRADGNERALSVELTPKGAALRQEALKVPGTMMDRLGLTRGQVTELHASMLALIAATSGSMER